MYGHLESDSEDDEEMEEVESQTDSDEDEPLTFEQNVEDMSENDMDEDFIEQYAAKNKKETVEMDSRMDIVENDLTVSHPKPSIPLVTQDYHLHKDYPILILPLLTQLFLKTCQGNLKHKIIECINKIVYFTTDRDQLMGMKCEAFGNVLVQLIDVELDKCTVEDKMQALAGVTVIQILCDRMDVGVWFRRQGVTQGVEGLDKMCAGLVGEDVEPLFESVFRHRSKELWKLGQMQPRVAGWTTERVGVAALEAKLKTMVSALVVRLETSGESGCHGVALERYYRSVREIGCGVDAHQWDSIYNIFVELLMELGTKQMTMYEIFQTGLVEFLVDFLVAGDGAHVFDVGGSRWTMPLRTRVRLFQSLMVYQHEAFGHLVRLVQEHVSKIEDFEVMHVDGKEMVPHFGRQMRLALVCTDPNDFDKSVHLVHVSVPVVATFKVLEKYIKSRLVDIVPTSVSNERVVQVDVFKHEDGVASKIPVSYAQVTKAAIKDQIQFLVNGQAVSNESMIFKMIYQSMSEDGRKSIWNQTHRVEFKRSNLFIPNQIGQPKFRKQFNTCGCETCKEIYHDLYILKTGKVRLNQALLLLQALYCIQSRLPNQSKNNYQNEKITSKVIKQFSESIFTVSTIFPNWMIPILYQYRFLIDFEIRYQFIQISMMGLTRNIKNWNDYYKKQLIKSHRIDNSTTFQVEKKKVRIHRSSVFESMIKVIPMCIDRSLMLEVEFFDEVGTGLGPTLEFFTLISKNIRSTFGVRLNVQQQSHQLWRFDESTMEGFLDPQLGLYPRPLQPDHHGYQDIILLFQHIGSFVAKAFLDGRRLDFTFNTLFLLQTFQQDFFEFHHDTNQSLEFIKMIDLTLYQSLKYLVGLVESDAEEDQVAALTLEYSLPNYPFYNLNDQGNEDDMVTKSNLVSFIDSIINATILCGIQNQINAFRIGFEKILPTHYFDCFEVNELQSMFGSGKDEDWTREVLYDTIKADHGYSNQSRIYKEFIEMLIDFNQVEKRDFLLFCTGSPRLPINGFKSLTPPLTIVCKTTEDQPDEYLPSVMTCVNYLKVPLYSSAQVMKQRFVMAIQEGQASFHLS
ncbi:hypothetical protein BC833DRAFT_606206 [Globomyces pollinis-pini]|nr:hypothetical protein BC833DRAFT_606206 [Globomyces pollinis-pini]